MIEEAQVVLHKADEPDFIADLFNPDVLASEDDAEIDLSAAMQMRPHCVTVMVRSWKG
jgi:hypothetical protein